MALTFTTWFSRSRITLNEKHFKVIFNNIEHLIPSAISKESKDAIKAAGNTELCEIVDVEPKSQCRASLTYWDVGIVYCTCGHFLKDDTTENKKYISSVLDLFSIPNFYIRKGRPHGHRYGKKEGFKEFHTAKQLQKRCRKKQYENIHDRFIRDTSFRKTMIALSRSEEVILEMDRLASEDHSHIATEEEIGVYRGNWWVRSNLVDSDTMPTRHRLDFKKALSTLYRLKKTEDNVHYENWSHSSSSWWQWQTTWWHPYYETSPQRWTQHWSNGETCGSQWLVYLFVAWISQRIWCTIYSDCIGNSQRSSLSPTGGVKSTSPVTENHDKNGYVFQDNNKNFIMTNVDNSDTTYTNKNDTNNHNAHDLHKWAQQRAVSVSCPHHVSHHIGSSRPWVCHPHAMSHMCCHPWFSSTSLSTSTCTSPSSSFSPSSCTLTCTPTWTTWTPWKITCATPPRGATTPTTSPSPSQFSNIVELRFFNRPLLIFSSLSSFSLSRPNVWPQMVRPCCCLYFCQPPPGPHASVKRFFK